jgi:hypothetical protein
LTRSPITRRRWLRLRAASAALLLWLLACAATASSGPASHALIFGTVWDQAGHSVYGVHVRLRRASEKKFRWEAYSDHRGEFGIRVPAARADYVLVPELKHGKNQPLPETNIHVEGDERVDIGVHLPHE